MLSVKRLSWRQDLGKHPQSTTGVVSRDSNTGNERTNLLGKPHRVGKHSSLAGRRIVRVSRPDEPMLDRAEWQGN